jgi:hypothetical protein
VILPTPANTNIWASISRAIKTIALFIEPPVERKLLHPAFSIELTHRVAPRGA